MTTAGGSGAWMRPSPKPRQYIEREKRKSSNQRAARLARLDPLYTPLYDECKSTDTRELRFEWSRRPPPGDPPSS